MDERVQVGHYELPPAGGLFVPVITMAEDYDSQKRFYVGYFHPTFERHKRARNLLPLNGDRQARRHIILGGVLISALSSLEIYFHRVPFLLLTVLSFRPTAPREGGGGGVL